jgi:ethanolamine utilization protein EutN
MNLGRVVGQVWATRKHESFAGAKILIVQPVETDGRPVGQPLAAVDMVGAGPGETVFFVTAREAVIGMTGDVDHMTPVDATIVGIVDFHEDQIR